MNGTRKRARWVWAVAGTAALTAALPAGTAYADETHHHSNNGPRVALIHTGQIDDPLEDVLEHASVLRQGDDLIS